MAYLREEIKSGNTLKVGDTVMAGESTLKVVTVGTNYITGMNESGDVVKKWFSDITRTSKRFTFRKIDFQLPEGLKEEAERVFAVDPYAAIQINNAWGQLQGENMVKKKMMFEHLGRLFSKFDISESWLSDVEDELIVESLTSGMPLKLSKPDKVINILNEIFNINSNNTDLSGKSDREKDIITKLLRLI